jgi:hypothetical protein
VEEVDFLEEEDEDQVVEVIGGEVIEVDEDIKDNYKNTL